MVRRARRGYDLLISFQQLSSDWHVDYEDSRKADGIILLGYGDYLEYRPRLEKLVERGTHFVRWGSAADGELGATVSSDNEQGGFDATTHLLQQGRRGSRSSAPRRPVTRSSSTVSAAIAGRYAPTGSSRTTGCRSMRRRAKRTAAPRSSELLARGVEFDAIFAASDVAAIGAMHALRRLGRRARGVAVVGFDDIPAASLVKPAADHRHAGCAAAAEALVDVLIEVRLRPERPATGCFPSG